MNYILSEIKLLWYTKIISLLMIMLCLSSGVTIFFNYNSTIELNDSYNKMIKYYQDNEMDLEEDLYSDSYGEYTEDKQVTIENPLAYYYNKLGTAVFSTSPSYSSSLLSESGIILVPIIFGILGLVIGTIDHKNKTMKYKVTRIGKNNYILVKIISLIIVNIIGIIVYFIIGKLFSVIAYSNLKDVIDFNKISVVNSVLNASILGHIIFLFMIALIYSMIGLLLGELFKSSLLGSISIILYCIAAPLFSKFDLKNSLYYFAEKVCNFEGAISLLNIKDTSMIVSLCTVSMILIITIGSYVLVIKKRSAF